MGGLEAGWTDLRDHPLQYLELRLAPRAVPHGERRRRRALARHVRHACACLFGEGDHLPCSCWGWSSYQSPTQ